MTDDNRRTAILDAATGVFLRYGFKKTSMDDLARAAGLSRQGLYLHFPTKEALFKEGLGKLIDANRAATKAALAAEGPVDKRILDMFVAAHGELIGPNAEHMNELMQTAAQLLGPVVAELEEEQQADLAKVLRSDGVAAIWKGTALTAKNLAEHLFATSFGIKHRVATPAEYRERMKIAVTIAMRGQ